MEMEQHNMQQLNMQQLKNGRKGRHALDGLVSEGNSFDKLSTPLLEDGGRSEGMPFELPPESGTQNDLTTSMVSV